MIAELNINFNSGDALYARQLNTIVAKINELVKSSNSTTSSSSDGSNNTPGGDSNPSGARPNSGSTNTGSTDTGSTNTGSSGSSSGSSSSGSSSSSQQDYGVAFFNFNDIGKYNFLTKLNINSTEQYDGYIRDLNGNKMTKDLLEVSFAKPSGSSASVWVDASYMPESLKQFFWLSFGRNTTMTLKVPTGYKIDFVKLGGGAGISVMRPLRDEDTSEWDSYGGTWSANGTVYNSLTYKQVNAGTLLGQITKLYVMYSKVGYNPPLPENDPFDIERPPVVEYVDVQHGMPNDYTTFYTKKAFATTSVLEAGQAVTSGVTDVFGQYHIKPSALNDYIIYYPGGLGYDMLYADEGKRVAVLNWDDITNVLTYGHFENMSHKDMKARIPGYNSNMSACKFVPDTVINDTDIPYQQHKFYTISCPVGTFGDGNFKKWVEWQSGDDPIYKSQCAVNIESSDKDTTNQGYFSVYRYGYEHPGNPYNSSDPDLVANEQQSEPEPTPSEPETTPSNEEQNQGGE